MEVTATLFHRLANAVPSAHAHLDPSTLVPSFISTIQSITSTTASIPHTSSVLDSPSAPHILSITFTSPSPLTTLRNHPSLRTFETANSLQLVLLPTFKPASTTSPPPFPIKLVVFDMDSTLIQQEVIDLLAAHANVEPLVASITHRAMNGELDFSASLRERVGLLKGLDASVFETLKDQITVMPGAQTLITVLKKKGVKTAVLSGGFTPLAKWLAGKLGLDYVHANFLEVDTEGKLTGRLEDGSRIVHAEFKRERLLSLVEELGIANEQVLAVGDGANDLLMLGAAGVGVAVNAKEKVQKEAPARLNGEGALGDVLYLLGMTSDEIDELAE